MHKWLFSIWAAPLVRDALIEHDMTHGSGRTICPRAPRADSGGQLRIVRIITKRTGHDARASDALNSSNGKLTQENSMLRISICVSKLQNEELKA